MIYKFTITPKGAIGTPFRSDTLFGHACWTFLLNYGKNKFEEFLVNAEMQKPELVFSDGFPSGWLPRPLLPKKPANFTTIKERTLYKQAAKRKWVNRSYAEKNNWEFCKLDNATSNISADYYDAPISDIQVRNTINRLTGTTLEESGLYSYERNWYEGIWNTVDIYVSTNWDSATLKNFLIQMFSIGYGRDQSIGLGAVSITTTPVAADFPSGDSSEGYYLSLSHCIPDKSISIKNSFYQIEPKYGKIWNGFLTDNPFKKPLLQLVPGSVLYCNKSTERAGKVIKGVHDDERVIENCMTILYPLPGLITKECLA